LSWGYTVVRLNKKEKMESADEIIKEAERLWRDDNEQAAIKILETIVENNGQANTLIGNMYANAERGQSNIKRDIRKARKYYEKAVELNNSEGALELADIYYFGERVKTNYKKAEYFWELAYNLNDEMGAFKLANYYYDHNPNQIEKAVSIYKELISNREFIGNCEYKLSKIYGRGIGVEKNVKLEIHYLTQGAEAFDFNCCSELARKYLYGKDVEKNTTKALEVIQKADTRELFDETKEAIINLIKSEIK
jgi:TPR repeat protein